MEVKKLVSKLEESSLTGHDWGYVAQNVAGADFRHTLQQFYQLPNLRIAARDNLLHLSG